MAKRKGKGKSKGLKQLNVGKAIEGPDYENDREHKSVTVRKIKNGFLAEHSSSGGGKPYSSETMYHPKRPKIEMTAAPSRRKLSKAREKALEKVKI